MDGKECQGQFLVVLFQKASSFSPGALYLMLSNRFKRFDVSKVFKTLQGESHLAKSAECMVDTD